MGTDLLVTLLRQSAQDRHCRLLIMRYNSSNTAAYWMGMLKTVVILSCVVIGSWLLFDGGRAVVTGSYTTPQSGEYQGQLGPWTFIVTAVGFQPESHLLKLVHLLLGVAWLTTATLLFVNNSSSLRLALVTSIVSIWYLPFGTLASILTGVYVISKMRCSKAA